MSPSKAMPLFGFTLIYLLSVNDARSQMTTPSLRPGVPIERALAPGERHSFQVNLEKDQLLQLTVDQRGIDVLVRVFSPAGKSLAEFDSPNGDEGPEDVSLIAATSGVYRIEVAPLEDGENVTAGRYEIKILELRAATEQELEQGNIQLALKTKGLALLGELAESLPQIHLPETRVRAQLQVAQLLWESDEKRATKLVQDAMDGVREYLGNVDIEDESYYQSYQTGMQLRSEVIQLLASRDPETALNFLISTRVLVDPNEGQNNGQANQELQYELSLAAQMSARNPKRALQIAEDSLKRGYSFGLIDTLTRLRSTDSESAVKLAQEIATKLQREKLLKNQEAANLAVSLLRMAPAPGPRNQGSASNTALLTDAEYRELFNKTLSEALSYTSPPSNFYSPERNAAQNILNSIKPLTGQLEAYAPGSAAIVEKKSIEFNTPPDPQGRLWQKYQETVNTGSLEAGLETASRAPREMRNQLYQQLAMKASNAGDFVSARQILTEHISNPFQRQRALANLNQQIIYSAIAKGRIEEALQSLSNFRTPKERATMVSQIVNQIGPGQKKANVLRFLEQARNMLGTQVQAEDQERMNALCEIGRAFLRYDPKRGFEVVEPLLEQFNEMSTAAVLLNGFGQQYYQDGELMMQNGNSLGNFAYQLSQTLGALAIANFDRAKAGADRVQRPEVRLSVYLSIAQHTINPQESGIRAIFRR